MTNALRFPAEWEAQSGVLIAWPHADTDWAERLAEVEETYIALVAAITRFEPVLICVADDDIETYAEMRLRSNRIDMDKVHFTTAAYDDTWLRDSGPITLKRADGSFQLLDFRFTGWGGKFGAEQDDALIAGLVDGVMGLLTLILMFVYSPILGVIAIVALGLYVVDCATREDAVAIARDLRRVNPSAVYEIRPIVLFRPGVALSGT